jgi:hypothetical protein
MQVRKGGHRQQFVEIAVATGSGDATHGFVVLGHAFAGGRASSHPCSHAAR